MTEEKFSVIKHVDDVIDISKCGDNWLISTEINGSIYDYVSNNIGEIAFSSDLKFMCKFKNNKDVGDILHKIMMALRVKKLRCYSIAIFPIDYFVQDYADAYHDSGTILVQAEETNVSRNIY